MLINQVSLYGVTLFCMIRTRQKLQYYNQHNAWIFATCGE